MHERCPWVTEDPLYIDYHDNEWGRQKTLDVDFFEKLCLEGAQAGLSWITILKKRENYRKAFSHFDIDTCAQLTDSELEKILQNPGVIRNKLKISSVKKNAIAAQSLIADCGSFRTYFWSWLDKGPIIQTFDSLEDYPTSTPLSEKISKDLKKRGFTFVGPTIIYAYMQSVGMVIDHTTNCFLSPK